MSNFVIDSVGDAIEAAQQYCDLGLPMPVDLVAYLDDNGIIVTDGTIVDEDILNKHEQE